MDSYRETLASDHRYQIARQTDQSGDRGWDFTPDKFDPRITPWSILRSLPSLIACAGFTALIWVALTL